MAIAILILQIVICVLLLAIVGALVEIRDLAKHAVGEPPSGRIR